MVRKIEDLRSTPDEVLIAEHDARAVHTHVGTAYYLDELDRRSRERATEAAQRLSSRSYYLTIANSVLSVVAIAVSVITLLRN
jgi:hypothetical protein